MIRNNWFLSFVQEMGVQIGPQSLPEFPDLWSIGYSPTSKLPAQDLKKKTFII